MKRYGTAIVVFLALCVPVWAQSVKLPATVTGEPGSFVRVPAETAEKEVRWLALDAGLSVFPADLLKDSKTTVVVAQKPGKYRLAAWTAKGDVPSEAAITTIIVGVDPGPGPGPGPLPDDPLTKALQAAFDKETDADKAALRGKFAALYRQAAEVAGKPEVTTWGNLFAVIKTASGMLGTSGKLPLLQAAVSEELKRVFPTDAAKVMTTDDRVLATQTFKKLATSMEGVR